MAKKKIKEEVKDPISGFTAEAITKEPFKAASDFICKHQNLVQNDGIKCKDCGENI